MPKYDAIIFDLFNTLALWQPDRLPPFEWRGKSIHSTLGILQHTITADVTEATLEEFIDAMFEANDELSLQRTQDMKEIPSLDRFLLTLRKIGYPYSESTRTLAEALSLKHMELLAAAVKIPPSYLNELERLNEHYTVSLISNFDHGPTARMILERDNAASFLSPIVISDDHGWRKPHARIFTDTLAELGIGPGNALYVGDSIEDDVVGAKGAGMDVCWINARGAELPADSPTPDYIVRDVPEIIARLSPD